MVFKLKRMLNIEFDFNVFLNTALLRALINNIDVLGWKIQTIFRSWWEWRFENSISKKRKRILYYLLKGGWLQEIFLPIIAIVNLNNGKNTL